MPIEEIRNRQNVLNAIAEYDQLGRIEFLKKYHFRKSRSYWLVHQAKSYDSKAIIGAARSYARPDLGPMKPSEFSGGHLTVKRKLEELGFTVVIHVAQKDKPTTNTLLLTWKETETPHSYIVHMFQQFSRQGYVDEPWRIRAYRHAKAGDDVWLLKQGEGPKGIFGVGKITGLPQPRKYKKKRQLMMAPIRFSSFVDPKREFLIGEWDVRKILSETQISARASGLPLKDEQANALAACITVQVSKSLTIAELALLLNTRSEHHPIGRLQALRTQIKGLSRKPTEALFSPSTIFENYAFHVGGRKELQFNIGFEDDDTSHFARFGVAFSLESSRSLPDVEELYPKIARFNEYLREFPNAFSDLQMWYYADGKRSRFFSAAPIPPAIINPGTFIFMGSFCSVEALNIETILFSFDQLLPLYKYVESRRNLPVQSRQFTFTPGCSSGPSATTATKSGGKVDISLRHNEIRTALHHYLAAKHGEQSVGTEQPTTTGGSIDVVLHMAGRYSFFEIKTAASVRGCIRDALGQLLEYSLWPGAQEAERLIIVGEPPHDMDGEKYLGTLRRRFSLPIFYRQFDMKKKQLILSKARA